MKNKIGYPMSDSYVEPDKPADIEKWIATLEFIKNNASLGDQAFDLATANWEKMEKLKFKNWVQFYESGDHLKYKIAQQFMWPTIPSTYQIPIKQEDKDKKYIQDLNNADVEKRKRDSIEIKRRKILGRLNSLEKLLTGPDAHVFATKELEHLVDAIFNLKKKILTINTFASVLTYNDLIVREANIAKKNGFKLGSEFLLKFGQSVPSSPAGPDAVPSTSEPIGGNLGSGADSSVLNKSTDEDDEELSKGMLSFLKKIDPNNVDGSSADDLEIDENDLVATAQMAPLAPPKEPETEIEINEPGTPDQRDVKPKSTVSPEGDETELVIKDDSNFNELINSAFSNIRVSDAVNRLSELAKIFKTREIGRQLAIVDMMLDSLGLSSFFPQLAEATRSALESNQYCLVRIEEILSKLTGAISSDGNSPHDLMNGPKKTITNLAPLQRNQINPGEDTEKIQNNLKQQAAEAAKRRELRRKQEDKKLEGVDTPPVAEPAEELKQAPQPTPVKPEVI